MSITAIVEQDSIKLPPGVHVPDGTKAEVILQVDADAGSKIECTQSWMLKYAGLVEGPEDFATEHDHYVRSTPKR